MIENDTGINLKTKAEIIEETAAFYNLNNRSKDEFGDCVYFDDTTENSCAVGRCLNNNVALGDYNSQTNASDLFEELGFDILKDEYKIKDTSFWQELQSLHDADANWDKNGITKRGLKYKNELLQKYGN